MKITPKQYAEAFLGAVADKKIPHETAAERLASLLHKNGDWSKRAAVVEAATDLLRAKGGYDLVTVESARPLTDAQKKAAQHLFHGKKAEFEERIDPELIAGIKITVNRENQLDGSLKHKLDAILGNR